MVAYTGTHDNDTALGWWRSTGGDSTRTHQDVEDEKARARRYLATDGGDVNWVMIRALLASVADTVLFPMQDVAGVGSDGRMNVPSVAGGNWRWRVTAGQINDADASRLREMVDIFER